MRDQVELIAYADRFGGSLRGLGRLLDGPLAGAFGGVHVLPFYRPFDGADAGFDPDDHLTVDPRLGTWDDVAALARGRDLVADLIVNHVSDRSAAFRDVAERGDASASAGMFLTFDRVFPDGATADDLLRITRPRPNLPFTRAVLGGRPQLLWTTFTPHQIDLDVHDPAARTYLTRVLRRLAECGVTVVRLDAVGYTVKTAGTSCFLTPGTYAFVDDLAAQARGLGRAGGGAGPPPPPVGPPAAPSRRRAGSASRCSPRCTRRTGSPSRRPRTSTASTTSPSARWCCTRCSPATPSRCAGG